MMFKCIFVTFPCGILGQVWYLIVLFPDLCHLSYFGTAVARLNIVNSSKASRVLDPDFLPRGISCRPRLSYNVYRQNQQSRLPRSSNIHTTSVGRNNSKSAE